jgi:ATP-dependent RNA helicase RhlE
MPFSKFGLHELILRAIKNVGYEKPTPVQAAAIPKVMQGEDVIGIAQTGTGKTAAFVLPILHRLTQTPSHGVDKTLRCLVLVPTRELAIQIVENVRVYGKHISVRVAAIYGGVDEASQIKALRRGVNIVIATPGRLLDLMEQERVDFSDLGTLVLDEADRMLHMGFLPDIERIIEALPRRRQTLMFSATLSKEIEFLGRRFLHHPKTVQLGKRVNPADTVKQYVYEVPAYLKTKLLVELLRQPEFKKVLVFVRMKDGVNQLTSELSHVRLKVARLHSSRSQEQREQALQAFKNGEVQVLIATDIVARGIDIEDVTHVVNYDFPVNPEDYIHRIGRTGRAEHQGIAISLVPRHDLNLLDHLELTIAQRLERKKLKGFDYNATVQRGPGASVARKDWRKRTREMESKRGAGDGAPAKKFAKKVPGKGVKPAGDRPVAKKAAKKSPKFKPKQGD